MMKLATLCYIKKDGRTLMMHRIKRKDDLHYGKWNGLGGKMQPGETPEECVIREVREESGLLVKDPHLNGFLTFPSFDQWDDWYVFVFTAQRFRGKLLDSAEGYLKWVKDQELLKLDLWEGDHIFLPWLEDEKFFSAKFNYREGRLKDHSVKFY
ncbi:MAG: DNA mismatch repair protein MutT [Candidatus Edwardsbacteria bacterium RIFOXYD12_FULL_50_11]|uniref:DNA mismatch repair protein MutT n=1 Tax=Candidatus Edwardsbacteria bacterium GWF2_54_11 TaxID=1817851 RepID=A0A1F5RHJ1_9BACT|nr:MAG: DNA mismatch repair protein MutT [Candidatus Edwardsbacteria bacterium RifOxyC12_full_54_24]OGF06212.1 MAG: DNA mismatch repair protein MutT [Candidatus Edwardsbacteria bacterium RifOxyA12_full_54_48]OGF12653.1 MAG: DNA mismatch repair protein MutT [Candidatus Edwardsbacteria bacterium GWE2_54_12]OGF13920.1 MAG: DNA mismatch repair protein MutT [Candidatus Edwardsbacteria bacterium GWF2_54_11]OGF17844.1 MAG: DNA mismatch repair protein MutT [Candidatus Edwardsbacteria bacterium RIFOXYD1